MAVVVACLAYCFNAPASAAKDHPYDEITARNAFGLQTPLEVIAEDPIAKSTVPDIMLTGITTILGRKEAFITITAVKAGKPREIMMLTEGQLIGAIEVRKIDERAGFVKIAGNGREIILGFPDARFK